MSEEVERSDRTLSVFLGVVTMASVGVLLVWDANAAIFPPRSHDFIAAFALAMIALAYLVFMAGQGAAWREMLKALALAAAFLFWAANQFWPNLPQATLFNDIAIALFVMDVFLVIVGWPQAGQGSVVELGDIHSGDALRITGATRDELDEAVAFDAKRARVADTGGVESAGIESRNKLAMWSMLLGLVIGVVGSNSMRPIAKREPVAKRD